MSAYKLIIGDNKESCGVLKDESSSIPFDPTNADYQAYLAWLAEGNTPQGADE